MMLLGPKYNSIHLQFLLPVKISSRNNHPYFLAHYHLSIIHTSSHNLSIIPLVSSLSRALLIQRPSCVFKPPIHTSHPLIHPPKMRQWMRKWTLHYTQKFSNIQRGPTEFHLHRSFTFCLLIIGFLSSTQI